MSTPSPAPPHRDPADVAPADSYHKADPVWVYRDGWRAGVIEAASARAVTVTYRPGPHRGTGVDTFTAPYVRRRADEDPALDRRHSGVLASRRPRRGGDGASALDGHSILDGPSILDGLAS
jgi:hypothetical protein